MKISLRRRHALMVGNGGSSHKIDYITIFQDILNPSLTLERIFGIVYHIFYNSPIFTQQIVKICQKISLQGNWINVAPKCNTTKQPFLCGFRKWLKPSGNAYVAKGRDPKKTANYPHFVDKRGGGSLNVDKIHCKPVHQSQSQNCSTFTSHIWSILWKN